MENLKIRVVFGRQSDAVALERLDRIAHKEIKWWDVQKRDEFAAVMRESKFYTIVAMVGDRPVGYLQASTQRPAGRLLIDNIFVIKGYRRAGVAKRMMDKFIAHWQKSGNKRIALITGDENMLIFKKLGFGKTLNWMEKRD